MTSERDKTGLESMRALPLSMILVANINTQGQLIVPDQLKAHLLYAAHDAAGHLHAELMLAHLREKYHWKGMTRDASN